MSLMRRTRTYYIVFLFWILNSLLRIVFGLMTTQGSLLDVPASPLVESIITISFLILGAAGFIAAIGFWV
ncbi:MAG: hypothetical protein ACTSV3_06695 [Candidatus Thorarchaeota archaeon]|nr:MAG: hypothetical protein DRP09_08035 [Candidatus Thorarchaeota archaeon]RLI58849.1 MAG: hypothetical protein DRO87_04645 [Candidatus Thorarchaeota archaeon]